MTTVAELIQWLQELDPDAYVYREDNEYGPMSVGDAEQMMAPRPLFRDCNPPEGEKVVVIS